MMMMLVNFTLINLSFCAIKLKSKNMVLVLHRIIFFLDV